MKILYFDCFSGVAGDMVLGALMGIGLDFEAWRTSIATLPVNNFRVEKKTVMKGRIACTKADVLVEEEKPPIHRRLGDVVQVIQGAALPEPVRERSKAVFFRLARAEAHVHNTTPEQVMFHEVGAVDAIVDIVGACLALHMLGVEAVFTSPVTVGRTQVDSAHGLMPTPAPATLELLKGVPVTWCDQAAEMTTPTGAVLVTTLAEAFGSPPAGKVVEIGYGAGDQDFTGRPNALRAILLESEGTAGEDRVVVMEANIDDMSPEHVGAVVPMLLEAGALDVFTTPVLMKKGRPGLRLTVLAPLDLKTPLLVRLFRETTTFGVRMHEAERGVLERRHVEVETGWGQVRIKLGFLGGEEVSAAPEHEDCVRVSESAGVPVASVHARALAVYHAKGISEN